MEVETIKNKIRAITGISFEKQDWMRKMGKSIRKWWLMFLFIAIFAGLSYYIFSSVLQKDIRHITIEQSNLIQSWLLWFSILAAGFTLIYQKVTKEEDRDINNLAILEPQTLHSVFLRDANNITINQNSSTTTIIQGKHSINFTLIQDLNNLNQYIFDVFNNKIPTPFFLIATTGNHIAIPKKLIIYFKDECGNPKEIEEKINMYSYIKPLNYSIGGFIHVYHNKKYSELFKLINCRKIESFFVLLHYESTSNKRDIYQVYKSNIEELYYINNKLSSLFLAGFSPLSQKKLSNFIEDFNIDNKLSKQIIRLHLF